MFDARLILAGQPADPIGTAQGFANLLNTNQAMGIQQAQEQRTLADLAKRQQHESGLLSLLSKAGPQPQQRLAALASDPRFFADQMALEKHQADIGSTIAKTKKEGADFITKQTENLVNLLHDTKDEADYQRRIADWPADSKAILGPTWAEAQPKVNALAMSASKRADIEQKGLDRTAAEKRARILAGDKAGAASMAGIDRLRNTIDANKGVVKYRNAAAELDSLRQLAQTGSGASDMALVIAFMKSLDPESVVREGEYAEAARTGTPNERMRGLVSKWWTGGKLAEGQKQAFIKAAEAAQSGHKARYEREVKKYKITADKRGYDLAELGLDDEPTGDAPKVRVTNGKETREIDPADLSEAEADGFRRAK